MTMRKTAWLSSFSLAAAACVAVAAATLPSPAHAQFFGDDWGGGGGYGYYNRRGSSDGFSFPFFKRPYAPPAESYRAPPPRKRETPPANTVAVIGDSMADWLAYGLEEIYADNPQIGIVRNVRLSSGLVHYEPRNDTLQWSQAIKDTLATERPSAIVVMLGLNDRASLRVPPLARETAQHQGKRGAPPAGQPPGEKLAAGETQDSPPPGTYEFHTDAWAKLYEKRIEAMMAALKSAGVPVLWVGLPALRGAHATAEMSYLDDLYEQAADKAGMTYVDIWDGFVDENGHYTVEGPDFEGQIRRLRSGDGVHFSKFGALKLAHLVDQELGRVLANPV
ncbi:MAG: SGNH family hydrolase, partial [Xanthobacteraceae bacterium]